MSHEQWMEELERIMPLWTARNTDEAERVNDYNYIRGVIKSFIESYRHVWERETETKLMIKYLEAQKKKQPKCKRCVTLQCTQCGEMYGTLSTPQETNL